MKAAIKAYVIGELLSGKNVDDGDDLLLTGLVDSLGVMRLINHLEQQYSIDIPPEDVTIENFTNIEAISSYLERRVSA
ncbi:MAG: acyl carrier protein [Thiogranum sp.]